MQFCYHCRHMTAGEPLYCERCGRTYAVKLCPSRHSNPRSAEVCSQCGSRDLSTPQPPVPWFLVPVVYLVQFLPGLLLLLLSLMLLVSILHALATHPGLLAGLVPVGMLLAVLWWLYLQLPSVVRTFLSKRIHKKSKARKETSHGH